MNDYAQSTHLARYGWLQRDMVDSVHPPTLAERVFNACWPVLALLATGYCMARVVWGFVT